MKAWAKLATPVAFAEHFCNLLAEKPAEKKLAAALANEIERVEIVDGKLCAWTRDYVIRCSKPSKKALKIPARLKKILEVHGEITFSSHDHSEWLGLAVSELDTYDWPVEKLKHKGTIYQCMRKYSDLYFLHPKKKQAVTLYDHEVGIGKPSTRGAGAIFLGHVAEYLKLAVTTTKLAKLKKVKIDDGVLRIDNEKKLVSIEQVTSLYTPKELAKVTVLDFDRCNLASTAGIQGFPNVEVLRIGNNKIVDTSGLAALMKLETLLASDNRIASLDGLPAQLTELTLESNDLVSMAGIGRFTQLVTLKLYGNKIERIEGVELLPALQKLSIHGNPAREMTDATVEAIRAGRERGLDASLDKEIEETYGLVEDVWLVAAPCAADKLEEVALDEWQKFLGREGEPVPWTVGDGMLDHAWLSSPELPMGRGQHFFETVARALSVGATARSYLLSFAPKGRNLIGNMIFAEGKMVFDEPRGSATEIAERLGVAEADR